MSKSPYRRPSRRIGTDKVRKTDSMSLLPVLESLEERRLLTTITVPAGDDPLSGPNLDLDNVPEAVFFTYYTQPFVNDLTNPTDLPDVASRALAIKVTISGTPGAEVDIKDLFGRDVYFRPFPDALAPPRVTFEGILENSDTSFDENGDFVLDPNGSAAYDTGPDSVESAVVDIDGDQLADILTVNNTGPNAVTIQYGQGQPFVPGENGQDDQPAEPDGTFGPNTYTDPESGEEVEVQSAIPYPSGTAGAYAIEVVDLDGDDFPEVIVAMRNTDNVVIFQNLGSTPVDPENPEEMKFEGFDDGTIIGVGDQPIDLAVDDSSNIWVLNYGDETIQQVVSQGNQRVFTLFGESGDRNLVDADNNNIGDALGAVDDARITIGRQAGDTLRGYISFQLTSQLIDAITLVGQHVVKSNLLVSGIAPPADIEYDVNLYMAATNQPDSDAAISDFEDTNYSIRIDSDGNPFLSGANQELPDQGRVYRISLGAINDARIQEAADTGNNFFDFRMQGNHPLFGIDESQLTQDELDQLDALAPYRLNSADADSTQFTVPTLNITLSDTFVAGTTYPVGEQPTSLNLADVDGDGFADFIVSNAGTDDIWYFRGNGTPTGFGLPDSDGDGFRDPTKIFSTQRPDQFNPSSADIDGDGIYDPIPDDSNPNDVAVADIDGDGFMDLAVALKGNSYPGITMTTSTGQNLANTIIPGGLAVFWGNGQLSLFQDFDSSRDGVQPDFLEDSFLENQPDPIITDGVPDLAFTLDPFFRGPAKIEVANINPVADFFEGDGVELNDLIVATVDPFAGSGNDTLAAVATRGGVYTLTGKYDAAHEWETITIGTYNPATGIYRNSPVLLPGEKIHGRVFSLPLETDTTLGFTTVPPDLPSIPYVDVVVLDVDSETLSAPIVGDVAAPDLIFTRSDNATPYEIDGDGLIRNVRVLLQGEGEPDPVPYYNDGIGSLVLSSADEDTRLTATAGIINAVPFQGSFVMDTSVGPIIAAFQPDQPLTTTDLPLDIPGSGLTYPDGSGRLMIGTPNDRRFTRNEAIYNAPSTIFMRNPSYGIRVEDGQSVDRIVIDGRLLGRTVIDGSIDVLTVGWLGGDVIINGDAGLVNVATDAGYIDVALQITPSVGDATESDLTEAYNFGRTGNIIQVGRTLRDLMVGGTLSTQVKVLGEVSDPSARNPLDNYRIVEYEAYQTDPANPSSTLIPVGPGMVAAYDNNAHGYFRTPGVAFQGGVYGDPLRGNVTRRGSTIYSENQAPLSNSTQRQAQFLGGPTTAVELVGWLDVG
ncbi:MAG TPA: VCBS repeat-containing protein, partial [Phycisphaeraceae bacterium]|nr:VCBS repeat-containing protein [Phycisphaeraceae bacterium]